MRINFKKSFLSLTFLAGLLALGSFSSIRNISTVSAAADVPTTLAEGRNGTALVINSGWEISSNLRGWSDAGSLTTNGAAFGVNDGTDVRMFTNVDFSKAGINGESVDPSTLNIYYKASITYSGRTNEYGAVGLLLGKKTVGNSTQYVTANIEPNTGHTLLYTFDVANGTTTSEANVESTLFGSGVHNSLTENQTYTFEVVKKGNSLNFYFDGKVIYENFVDIDGYSTSGITPLFGISSLWVQATYTDLEIRCFSEGYGQVEKDAELEAARVNNNFVFDSNFGLTEDLRTWGYNGRIEDGKVSYPNNYGKDVREYTNVTFNNFYVGEEPGDLTKISLYQSAKITYTGANNEYGAIGFLFGKKALTNGDTRYYSIVMEMKRGHFLVYTFDVASTGGTTAESNLLEGFLFENGSKNPQNVGDSFLLEVIKSGDTLSIYVDGKAAYKGLQDVELAGLTATAGVASLYINGTFSDMKVKVLDEGAKTVVEDLINARANTNYNYLTNEQSRFSTSLIGNNGDYLAYDPSTRAGDAWCDDRTFAVLHNPELDSGLVEDANKNRVSASELSVYYSALFTYEKMTMATYNHTGIVLGYDAKGVYHSVQLECYKPGAGDHRGFLFAGSSDSLEISPFYTSNIPAGDYTPGSTWLMEIIKSGNTYRVYVDGVEYASVTLEGLTPTFGIYSFGTYAKFSEACLKILDNGFTPVILDSNNYLSSLSIKGEPVADFNKDVTEYTYVSETLLTSADITYTTESDKATVSVSDFEGEVLVKVTAENKETRTYKIKTVAPKSTVATISSLTILGQNVEVADEMNFTAPLHVKSIAPTDVEVTTTDAKANATVSVEGNLITIEVVAEDLLTTKTYTVNVSWNLSNDATLSSITVKGKQISNFNKDTLEYNVSVKEEWSILDVEFEVSDEYATAELSETATGVEIVVTAEDGTTLTYVVNIKVSTGGCGGSIIASSAIVSISALVGIAALFISKRKEK